MTKNIFYIFLILMLLASCIKKNRETDKKIISIKIEAAKLIENNKADFLRECEAIIPLETRDSSYIKRIDRLILTKDKIYILDNPQNSVFIFSKSGAFLRKIHSFGKGPGEYLQIQDFCIDEAEDKLIITADIPYKFLYFNLEGIFQNEVKANNWYESLIATKNHLVMYSISFINKQFRIHFKDKLNNNFNYFLPFDPDIIRNFSYQGPKIVQSQAYYFCQPFYDTIYKITDEKVEPAYFIDFGNKKLPDHISKSKKNGQIYRIPELESDRYFYFVSGFREMHKYIVFEFANFKIAVYSKINKKVDFYNNSLFDSNFGISLNYFPHDGQDNNFISIIKANEFVRFFPDTIYRKRNLKANTIYEKYKYVKSTDNPVLMIYSFKD